MSGAIAGTVTQPSKAHNLTYILFGYAFTIALIPSIKDSGTPEQYLIIIAIIGGFFGTFLFFLKPIEKIMYRCFLKFYKIENKKLIEKAFYSPFLTEARGQIIGGIFFSITCLIALLNSNFNLLSEATQITFRITLVFMASVVIVSTAIQINRLKPKIRVLTGYYEEVERPYQNRLYPTIVNDLRQAFNCRDWAESFSIELKNIQLQNQSKEVKKTETNDFNSLIQMREEIYKPLYEELNYVSDKIKKVETLAVAESANIDMITGRELFIKTDPEFQNNVRLVIDYLDQYERIRNDVFRVIDELVKDYLQKKNMDTIVENQPYISIIQSMIEIGFISISQLVLRGITPKQYIDFHHKRWKSNLQIKAVIGNSDVGLSEFQMLYAFIMNQLGSHYSYSQEKRVKNLILTKISSLSERIKTFI